MRAIIPLLLIALLLFLSGCATTGDVVVIAQDKNVLNDYNGATFNDYNQVFGQTYSAILPMGITDANEIYIAGQYVNKVIAGTNTTVSCTGASGDGNCTINSTATGGNSYTDSNAQAIVSANIPIDWDVNVSGKPHIPTGQTIDGNIEANLAGKVPWGDVNITKTGNWTGTFDSQEGSYYLDYTNLTNKPSIPTDTNYQTAGATFDAYAWTKKQFDTDQNTATTNSPTFAGLTVNGETIIYNPSDYRQLTLMRSNSDNSTQRVAITTQHYDADENKTFLIGAKNDNGTNQLFIGGATNIHNSATSIEFYTGATSTTTTGTKRMDISSTDITMTLPPTIAMDNPYMTFNDNLGGSQVDWKIGGTAAKFELADTTNAVTFLSYNPATTTTTLAGNATISGSNAQLNLSNNGDSNQENVTATGTVTTVGLQATGNSWRTGNTYHYDSYISTTTDGGWKKVFDINLASAADYANAVMHVKTYLAGIATNRDFIDADIYFSKISPTYYVYWNKYGSYGNTIYDLNLVSNGSNYYTLLVYLGNYVTTYIKLDYESTPSALLSFANFGTAGTGGADVAQNLNYKFGNDVQIANNNYLTFLSAAGTDDGTRLYKSTADGMIFNYAGNAFIYQATDNKNINYRDSAGQTYAGYNPTTRRVCINCATASTTLDVNGIITANNNFTMNGSNAQLNLNNNGDSNQEHVKLTGNIIGANPTGAVSFLNGANANVATYIQLYGISATGGNAGKIAYVAQEAGGHDFYTYSGGWNKIVSIDKNGNPSLVTNGDYNGFDSVINGTLSSKNVGEADTNSIGMATVTLPIVMLDANYHVSLTPISNNPVTLLIGCYATGRKTTEFTAVCYKDGVLASEQYVGRFSWMIVNNS